MQSWVRISFWWIFNCHFRHFCHNLVHIFQTKLIFDPLKRHKVSFRGCAFVNGRIWNYVQMDSNVILDLIHLARIHNNCNPFLNWILLWKWSQFPYLVLELILGEKWNKVVGETCKFNFLLCLYCDHRFQKPIANNVQAQTLQVRPDRHRFALS